MKSNEENLHVLDIGALRVNLFRAYEGIFIEDL